MTATRPQSPPATQRSGTWAGHGSRIAAMGVATPEAFLDNDGVSLVTDTSDAWIRERTGIHRRNITNVPAADLAAQAGREALAASAVDPELIDMVIVASTTHDVLFPSAACIVQARLGLQPRIAFDAGAACSGFVYSLGIADALLGSGAARAALVIGAERLSRLLDVEDRSTCVLFGDGAGAAVLLPPSKSDEGGLRSFSLGADGAQGGILWLEQPQLSPRLEPVSEPAPAHGRAGIRMNGQAVFLHATRQLFGSASAALAQAGITSSEIDVLVPHQANERIIRALGRALDIPDERVFCNIADHANTSAASIPLALHEASATQQIKRGDTVLLSAFGAGLTWGSAVLDWTA